MDYFLSVSVLLVLALTVFDVNPTILRAKHEGLHFLRVHRPQISFCICKETADQKRRRELVA